MACPSVAAFISIHNMCAHFVARHGTERVRTGHLPDLVSMGAIASYCLTEPSSGSDAAALRTRAVKDGTDWVLNGAKAFISGGGYSDHGHALGGGCELAMMCDIIVAARSARFGQPEIKLGIIPGMVGTQRLARLVGRTRAMELVLTGSLVDAEEAARIGLATEVVDDDALPPRAMEIASLVSGFSRPAVRAAREAIARADEQSLREGLRCERRHFHALFANADRTEGMSAFLDKRAPHFQHR